MSIQDYLPKDISKLRMNRDEGIDTVNMAIINTFKDKIRRKRKESSMTQIDLAENVGLKQPAISRIESHNKKNLSLNTLQQCAMALDCVLVIDIVPRSEMIDKLEKDTESP